MKDGHSCLNGFSNDSTCTKMRIIKTMIYLTCNFARKLSNIHTSNEVNGKYSGFRMRQHAEAIMSDDKIETAVTLLEHRSHIKNKDSGVQECSTSRDNGEEQQKAEDLKEF